MPPARNREYRTKRQPWFADHGEKPHDDQPVRHHRPQHGRQQQHADHGSGDRYRQLLVDHAHLLGGDHAVERLGGRGHRAVGAGGAGEKPGHAATVRGGATGRQGAAGARLRNPWRAQGDMTALAPHRLPGEPGREDAASGVGDVPWVQNGRSLLLGLEIVVAERHLGQFGRRRLGAGDVGALRVRARTLGGQFHRIVEQRNRPARERQTRQVEQQLAQAPPRREYAGGQVPVGAHEFFRPQMARPGHQRIGVEIGKRGVGQQARIGGSGETVEIGRPRQRRLERDIGGHMQSGFAQVPRDACDVVRIIRLRAQHDARHDEDAVAVTLVDGAAYLVQHVLRLAHVDQRRRIEALQPDEHAATTGARHAREKLRFADDVERHARAPPDAQRFQGVAQTAQVAGIAAQVVVVEADDPALVPRCAAAQHAPAGDDVAHHQFDGTDVVARAEPGQGTEFAGIGTAARDLQAQRQHLLLSQQVEAGRRHLQRIVRRSDIDRLQVAAAEIVIDAPHRRFGIADDDGVEPGCDQFAMGARQRAAEHRLGAAPAPVVGNLARAVEVRMQGRDEQQVVVLAPVGIGPGVVDDFDVDIGRQQGGDQRAGLRLQHAAVVTSLSVVVDEGRDDADFQRFSGAGCRCPRRVVSRRIGRC